MQQLDNRRRLAIPLLALATCCAACDRSSDPSPTATTSHTTESQELPSVQAASPDVNPHSSSKLPDPAPSNIASTAPADPAIYSEPQSADPAATIEQPAPRGTPPQESDNTAHKPNKTQPVAVLAGAVTQIGPRIDNPDGDGKVVPLIISVRLPDGWDVASADGTLTIRSLEDESRILWIGPFDYEPEVSDQKDTSVFVNVPSNFDESDPNIIELVKSPTGFRVMQTHGIMGPPVELRFNHVTFADGTEASR